MDIDTLTSGPGIVFTYKDMNECLQDFCAELVSYSEKDLRSRTVGFHTTIQHLKHLIYIKDTRIDNMQRKLSMVSDNITRIVNSRIYEKGNALIFELDKSSRELRFYQEHIHLYEKELKDFIREEFRLMLQKKDLAIDMKNKYIVDMQNRLTQDVKQHVISEQKRIKKEIK